MSNEKLEMSFTVNEVISKPAHSIKRSGYTQSNIALPADWCDLDVICVLHDADLANMTVGDVVLKSVKHKKNGQGCVYGVVYLPGGWADQQVDIYKLE